MSALAAINAAKALGIRIAVDRGDLVLRANGPISDAVVAALKQHKAEILALLIAGEQPLAKTSDGSPCRFSDLWDSEADYARALIRYARQDVLGLALKDGELVIAIGAKSDPDLLGELRAHEAAVIAVLREGHENGAISTDPAQSAEAFRPPIVRVPRSFGSPEKSM